MPYDELKDPSAKRRRNHQIVQHESSQLFDALSTRLYVEGDRIGSKLIKKLKSRLNQAKKIIKMLDFGDAKTMTAEMVSPFLNSLVNIPTC